MQHVADAKVLILLATAFVVFEAIRPAMAVGASGHGYRFTN